MPKNGNYIPTNSVVGFSFLTPSSAFIICRLLEDGHSDWCGVVRCCRFDFISLVISSVEQLLMCYSPSICLLWRNDYFHLLLIFWLGCLFFCYWVEWAGCIFWKLSPCWLYHLQICPPSPYVLFCLWLPLQCKSL